MKNKLFFMSGVLSLFFIYSCSEDEKQDLVSDVSKMGSVETEVKVTHLTDSADIITTSHKVWKNGSFVKDAVHYDTIPSLGRGFEPDPNGSSQMVKKDYEIYITVK